MEQMWTACYERLLPYALDDPEVLHQRARGAVIRQWQIVTGPVDLTTLATDEDAHLLVALGNAYNQGWFDGVLSEVVDDLVQLDQRRWEAHHHYPSSFSYWLPSNTADTGRGRAFGNKTKQELAAFFGSFKFASTLEMIRDAHSLAGQHEEQAIEERIRRSVEAIGSIAIAIASDLLDDAPWYEYLDLPERLAWLAAALAVPDIPPEVVCRKVEEIMEAQDANDIPSGFVEPGGALAPDLLDQLSRSILETSNS